MKFFIGYTLFAQLFIAVPVLAYYAITGAWMDWMGLALGAFTWTTGYTIYVWWKERRGK